MENHTTLAKKLVEGIWPLLNKLDMKVQIKNFGPDHVCVNGMDIKQKDGFWKVPNCPHDFMYRKAAVGYTVARMNKDTKMAQCIMDLDRRINALTVNIEYYHTHHKLATCEEKKEMYLARISYETPMREMLYNRLMENLKTIQIA